MDDARTSLLLILKAIAFGFARVVAGVLILGGAQSAFADVTYISPAEITRLGAEFDGAALNEPTKVTGRAWSCSLYGVRSKLQVQLDLKLYDFKQNKSSSVDSVQSFVNTGDEPIEQYSLRDHTLEGRGANDVLDQVRLTKDGHLVSKLSVPSRGITVAFAVCTGS